MTTTTRFCLDDTVDRILAAAGIHGPRAPLTPMHGGDDNRVYLTCAGGLDLVIKTARGADGRFAVADWTSRQFAVFGVPGPQVISYTEETSVETRCPGSPLDTGATTRRSRRTQATVAERAGQVLRLLHTIPVTGAGRLDPAGTGRYRTCRQWLVAAPPGTDDAAPDLLGRVRQALDRHVADLPEPSLRLLHGDWVARHVIVHAGDISGVVDLQSVRGGDPLVDLAGWSVQEPAFLSEALFTGYDPHLDDAALLALTLYRLRIGAALLRYHTARSDTVNCRLYTRQLAAGLEDLARGNLRAVPRVTAPESR